MPPGERACLASNSLLEAVVCGQAVGAALAATPLRAHAAAPTSEFDARLPDDADPRWQRLRTRMWEAMGPVRNATDLGTALAATRAGVAAISAGEVLLRDRFNLAAAMLAAALARRESRGAHWRSDYPQRDTTRDGPQAVHGVPPDHS
jgi:L-aspartate oxidase